MLETGKIMQQARTLIGARLRHNEHNCTVIEVLDDRLELILEADKPSLAIQLDAYGNARREMRALYIVPILNEAGDEFHPSFLSLIDLEKSTGKSEVGVVD